MLGAMQRDENDAAAESSPEPSPALGAAAVTPSALLVLAANELLYHLGRPNLLREACRITCDVLAADLVVALASPESSRSLVTKAQYGFSDEEWAAYQMIEFEEPIADAIRER